MAKLHGKCSSTLSLSETRTLLKPIFPNGVSWLHFAQEVGLSIRRVAPCLGRCRHEYLRSSSPCTNVKPHEKCI